MKMTEAAKFAAETSPVVKADGKRFVFYEDAFEDWNHATNTFRFTARAFSPDDVPDEEGYRPCYDLHFEVTNPEAEEAEDACDWDVISEYEENGDVIEAEAAKTLIDLVRFWR